MTEGGETQFPKPDLENETQLLRLEVERLNKILTAHGLPTNSALNSVFLDGDFAPYPDQWAYLFSVQ
jgi:hypothetical protein